MGSNIVLWAGKRLSDEEAAAARRAVDLLRRAGDPEAAEACARCLPGADPPGTPAALPRGAPAAPGLELDGGLEA